MDLETWIKAQKKVDNTSYVEVLCPFTGSGRYNIRSIDNIAINVKRLRVKFKTKSVEHHRHYLSYIILKLKPSFTLIKSLVLEDVSLNVSNNGARVIKLLEENSKQLVFLSFVDSNLTEFLLVKLLNFVKQRYEEENSLNVQIIRSLANRSLSIFLVTKISFVLSQISIFCKHVYHGRCLSISQLHPFVFKFFLTAGVKVTQKKVRSYILNNNLSFVSGEFYSKCKDIWKF